MSSVVSAPLGRGRPSFMRTGNTFDGSLSSTDNGLWSVSSAARVSADSGFPDMNWVLVFETWRFISETSFRTEYAIVFTTGGYELTRLKEPCFIFERSFDKLQCRVF